MKQRLRMASAMKAGDRSSLAIKVNLVPKVRESALPHLTSQGVKSLIKDVRNFTLQLSIALLLGVAVAGCSAQHEGLDEKTKNEIFDQFIAGRAELDCRLKCSARWGSNRNLVTEYYKTERWSRLAETVIQIGFNNDLAWFYLGRAAEGWGAKEAALLYYQRALNTQNKCDYLLNNCHGLDVPAQVASRMMALSA